MRLTLYTMNVSHPGHTARLMLAHKRLDARIVDLPAGLHPALLWARGFRRGTVPALRIDGRRIEGSLAIARELERLVPEPALYPAEARARTAVEEAERWGEGTLQNLPRQLVRYAVAHDLSMRTWFMRTHARMPLPRLSAVGSVPVALAMAARVGGSADGARDALARLPSALDRVDALLAAGTIGGPVPNAADFQIAPTVRLVAASPDLAPMLAGRPCDAWARELVPALPALPRSAALTRLVRG